MRQRGRKSAASENVVNLAVVDISQEKPEPLGHLTPEQQQVCSEVVAAMKPGSFNAATFPLLASYCSHVTWARFIAAKLHECNIDSDLKKVKVLLSMHNSQSATLSMLATKLRLLAKTNTRLVRQESDASSQPWNIRSVRPYSGDDKPAA